MCKFKNAPDIKKIDFSNKDYITAILDDGRTLKVPVHLFPEIEKTSMNKRQKVELIMDQYFAYNTKTRTNWEYSVMDLLLASQFHFIIKLPYPIQKEYEVLSNL